MQKLYKSVGIMHSTHSAKNLGVVFTCLAIIGTMVVVPAHPLVQVAGETSNVNVSITPGASTKFTDAYSPNPVSIDVGDTVIWTNNDPPHVHTAVSGTPSEGPDGKFGGTPEAPFSEIIFPGASSNHTFTESGEYPYYCVLHPNMVGKVIVGQTENGVTVRTDRSSYEIGDHVKITGKVDPVIPEQAILLRIMNKEGELARVDLVGVQDNGLYSYEFPIAGGLFEPGRTYTVQVAYGDATAETNFSISRLEGGCEGLAPTILGTDRDDVLVGTDGDDVIDGLEGNDVIRGQDGDDTICGGPGMDEIHTGEGDDRAYGGRGNDELYGDLGKDRLWGGTGWDKLFGGFGDDTIFGGKGNDMLQGEEGNDKLDGQAGEDVLDGVPDNDDNVPPDHRNIRIDLSDIDFEYDQGDGFAFSGTIEDLNPDEDRVNLDVKGPGTNDDDFVTLDEDEHEFSFDYEIDNTAEDGIYSIEVEYDGDSVFAYFLIDEDNDPVAVELDNDVYEPGDTAEIIGEVENRELEEDVVEITILDPNADDTVDEVDLDNSDEFSYAFDIANDDDVHGRYAVTVSYNNDDDDEGYAIFEVSEVETGDKIAAHTSKAFYLTGEVVVLSGNIDEADVEPGKDVSVIVFHPDGDALVDGSVSPNQDGTFEFEFQLDEAELGGYEALVSHAGYRDKLIVFFVVSDVGIPSESNIKLEVDDQYASGDEVEVSGNVEDVAEDVEEITITLVGPEGDVISDTVVLDGDEFFLELELDDPAIDGVYTVWALYDSDSAFSYFLVDDEEDKVYINIDSEVHQRGDVVEIVGVLDDAEIDIDEISLTVLDPIFATIIDSEIELDGDEFQFEFELDEDALLGRYAIAAANDGKQAGFRLFEVRSGGGGNGEEIFAQLADTTLSWR